MIQVRAGVKFERVLCVFLHEDEQNNHEAKQPTNVGQSLIDLLETSLHNNCSAGPPQYHAGIGIRIERIRHNLSQIADNGPRFFSFLADWPYALIGRNLIVRDEYAD